MKRLTKNFRPSTFDPRDRKVKVAKLPVLPSVVDLKPWSDEVEDQGFTNSCTANAGSSKLELVYNRAGLSLDFSRLYLYWYVRLLGDIRGDEGAYPRDIGKALQKYGICLEETWEFLTSMVNVAPSAEANEEAKLYPTFEYARIEGTNQEVIDDIRNCVARGIPVLTSMAVHDSFYNLSGPWQSHSWNTTTSPLLGYHEVVIIGYDDVNQRFLAENSWGPDWGDGGYFGIPYSLINTVVDEWWILTRVGVNFVPIPELQEQEIQPIEVVVPEVEIIEPPQPLPEPEPEEKSDHNYLFIGIGVAVAIAVGMFLL